MFLFGSWYSCTFLYLSNSQGPEGQPYLFPSALILPSCVQTLAPAYQFQLQWGSASPKPWPGMPLARPQRDGCILGLDCSAPGWGDGTSLLDWHRGNLWCSTCSFQCGLLVIIQHFMDKISQYPFQRKDL